VGLEFTCLVGDERFAIWEREAGETRKTEKYSMEKECGRRGRGNEIEVKEDGCCVVCTESGVRSVCGSG
jgi:hypothetical protein